MSQSTDDAPPRATLTERPGASSGPHQAMRVPPHNLAAEESLLGAMLLSKDAIATAVELVDTDDFYKPAHGHIFEAVASLFSAGEPVDPITVAEELNRAGLLEGVGGPATLVSLQAGTPATSNAARYAKIVEEHSLLRRLIRVAGDIAELGYELPDDVTKAVDLAESMVFQVAQRRVTDSTAPIRDLLGGTLDRLEQLYERGDALTGVPTGYVDLDALLSGLQPSALIVVGARPSAGKTAFALGIASHVALTAERPVMFFSLEMSHLELTQRIICSEARVDSTRMRNGRLNESDWTKINSAIGRLAEAQLWIDDNPQLTVMEIRAKARRLKSRVGDLGLVVVDYLQLMTGRSSAESRQVEVSEISRGLKILARELECPVIALSQLSRSLEMRADKRPMLADLRESGCLTADTQIAAIDRDTGGTRRTTLGQLLSAGERDIPVWTLDEHLRFVPGVMTHVFSSGIKDTFELRLASGRVVTASANHPFLTVDGWVPLGDLAVGDRLAVRPTGPDDPTSKTVPAEVATYLDKAAAERGLDAGALLAEAGASAARAGVARRALRQVTEKVDDPWLHDLIEADVLWDTVSEIVPLGPKPVYDATVVGTHNFVANGIVAHNSIEQDSDVVMFIYRDDIYNEDSPDRGTAEIIVAKHRNGPTDKVRLAFLGHHTRFENMARGA
ncbi:MAG: replicative DNA helicase [Acidimicrobiales bacterium]|nr:replicative DNA helicase [Acidimicrobiales bacterium]